MKNERILVVGLNWIGDAIMSMPAMQACRVENPDAHIALLVKPYLKPLWEMHSAPDEVLCIEKTLPTIRKLREGKFSRAYILPNSFRSAFLPAAAGIRERVGLSAAGRNLLLSRIVPVSGGHQSNEYFPVLAPQSGLAHEFPRLNIPTAAVSTIKDKLAGEGAFITLMPGAARGESKMWPLDHFEALGKQILSETDFRIVFAGGPADAPACEKLANALGDRTVSLAGKTGLQEWAALLGMSAAAVANDSGGMHLAAAVGTPVIGIFGVTDPAKTAPLAETFRVLQNSKIRSRDIARNSAAASDALASILPDTAFSALQEMCNM